MITAARILSAGGLLSAALLTAGRTQAAGVTMLLANMGAMLWRDRK